MPLFGKPRVALWPKSESVDIYLDKKENNHFSLDLDLWHKQESGDLDPLRLYLRQNRIDSLVTLVPDDVILTKSFIYDSKISSIEAKEVIGLAESFIHFKIDPAFINYNLVTAGEKTIIQARIFDKSKLAKLQANLSELGLKSVETCSISSLLSRAVSHLYHDQYFFLYPLSSGEHTLILAKNDSVYLTANFKGNSIDIQKTINYSNLYFSSSTTKLFYPQDTPLEVISTTRLEKTPYRENQIAGSFNKASNLPLPVLGYFLSPSSSLPSPVIIKSVSSDTNSPPNSNMKQRPNILPIIAVFLFTASIASAVIWFVLNRENTPPASAPTPTPSITQVVSPTAPPVSTQIEIDKKIKIQVLNATDINGQAALLKGRLVTLGFANVTVGNSSDKAAVNSIRLKPSLASSSAYFQSQLASYFDAEITSDLKPGATYDAVFTIGTDLSGQTTPVATASPTIKVTPVPTE